MADPTPPTVTAPEGEPRSMTFRLRYNDPTPLDKLAADNGAEAKWQDGLRQEMEAAAAAQQQAEGATPGAAPAEKRPMQPSMLIEGLKAGAASAYEGLKKIDEGLGQLPESPAQGARKVLVEGLMPVVFSPLTAVMSSIGQTVENFTPEVANAELFDASAAFTVRHLLAGAPALSTIPPEQLKAMQQPMTVREAIETLGPVIAPALPKAAKTAKTALGMAAEQVRAAGPERGAIGPPPPPSAGRPSDVLSAQAAIDATKGAKATLDLARRQHASFQKQIAALEASIEKMSPEARAGSQQILTELKGFEQQAAQGVTEAEAALGTARQQAEAAKPAGPLGGPPVPPEGVDVRLNLTRVYAPETVIETMADLNKFVGAEILKQHRKVKHHAETLAEAQASRWSLEQMLVHDPETILVDAAKGQRLRDTAAAAAAFYDTLGQRVLAGDQRAAAQLDSAFAVALKLAALDEGQARNIARGLEMRKEMAMGERAAKRAAPEQILAAARTLGESEVDPLLMYRRVARLSTPQQRNFFVNLYNGFRAGRDISHAAWIQALLTNPKTHAANWGGTGLVVHGDIAETYAAGWINRILTHDPDGVQRVEGAIKLRALAEAYEVGYKLMVEAWQTGEEPFAAGKTKEHPLIVAETYGFSPDTWPGKVIDTMGNTLRSKGMPTRGLISEDAYWKGVAYHLEIQALAAREAIARGLEGEQMQRVSKELAARPTVDMIQKAQDHAILLTLNKQLGPMGQAFMKLANAIPFGRVLFPFMQTPGNSFKWGLQRLPQTSWLSYQNWSDIMAGGAERDRALARMALGAVAATLIAARVSDGTITGSNYGLDKNLAALQRDPKSSTKPPASICPTWTDECYGINRMDPVGAYIVMVADYVELTSKIPADQALWEEWAAYGFAVLSSISQAAITKNWNTGLRNVLDATHDPNTAGAKMVANFAKSIVPAGVREIAREIDDNQIREVNGIADAILSGIPGLASSTRGKRNWITGEKIQYPPGWGPDIVTPINVTKITKSPVWRELQDNNAHIPQPPDHIMGPPEPEGPQMKQAAPPKGIRLSDEWYDRLITLQTQEIKIHGLTLFESLEKLVTSEKYLKYPSASELRKAKLRPEDGTRKVLLDATYDGFRKKAVSQLIDEMGLKPKLKELRMDAIRPALPRTDSRSPIYQGTGTAELPATLGR